MEIPKITFRQIKGGGLRCNQTGEIVPRYKARAYRRALFNQMVGRHKPKSPKKLPEVVFKESHGSCPNCQRFFWAREGENQCTKCGFKFKIITEKKLQDSAYCPRCLAYNVAEEGDLVNCFNCGKEYIAIKRK